MHNGLSDGRTMLSCPSGIVNVCEETIDSPAGQYKHREIRDDHKHGEREREREPPNMARYAIVKDNFVSDLSCTLL